MSTMTLETRAETSNGVWMTIREILRLHDKLKVPFFGLSHEELMEIVEYGCSPFASRISKGVREYLVTPQNINNFMPMSKDSPESAFRKYCAGSAR